ncbi:MAG: hypothetical protein EOP84_07120 [Verrucomicrobiaceae bacterium]|nr:MAG: hypothetical protein EOP84_07120 [Verrucomicrobiaceae bacterium]
MKNFCAAFLLAFTGLSCQLIAQHPVDERGNPVPPSDNILIELQVVAIPEAVAFPLVNDLKEEGKAEAAYQQIQKLLMEGTGKLIGWPNVTTRSGQRAVVEGISEIRFATQFEGGAASIYLTVPEGQITKELKEIRGIEMRGVPTSFDTRNIGVTLEVEPVCLDGRTIDLNLVPQHVRLKSMNKVTLESGTTKEKMVVEQPEFDVKRIVTSLKVKSGERKLLGVFKTSEFPDHLELFILKAEVKKVE